LLRNDSGLLANVPIIHSRVPQPEGASESRVLDPFAATGKTCQQ